jgi:hypothetical protein
MKKIILIMSLFLTNMVNAGTVVECADTFASGEKVRYALTFAGPHLDHQQQALASKFLEIFDGELIPEVSCFETLNQNGEVIRQVLSLNKKISSELIFDDLGDLADIRFTKAY